MIHGGVGTLSKEEMTPELRAQYVRDLESALLAGHAILDAGGTSLKAIEAAILVLENSPRFNAEPGAALTRDGTVELDASIMDGRTKEAGAVAGLQRVKNPIAAARTVMDKTEHVLLAGPGAKALHRGDRARVKGSILLHHRASQGAAPTPPAPGRGTTGWARPTRRFGTVGTVALDRQGHLAAGTSTGGITNKRPRAHRRLADHRGRHLRRTTPHARLGATGDGEFFIRLAVAHDIAARVRDLGKSVEIAAETVIHEVLTPAGGEGGVIVLGPNGRFAMIFNTEGMYRGLIGEDGVFAWRSPEEP